MHVGSVCDGEIMKRRWEDVGKSARSLVCKLWKELGIDMCEMERKLSG